MPPDSHPHAGPRAFAALAFGPGAIEAQRRAGTREAVAGFVAAGPANDVLDERAAAHIAAADSLFVGTCGSTGWPHVQHRGGPPGFLRVLDPRTLAFADFAGNRQLITVGNLAENPRLLLFVLDRREHRRLKVWGEAEAVEGDAALLARVAVPGYPVRVERAIRVRVLAWDFNCRQHMPRYGDLDGLDDDPGLPCEERLARLRVRYDDLLDSMFAHE